MFNELLNLVFKTVKEVTIQADGSYLNKVILTFDDGTSVEFYANKDMWEDAVLEFNIWKDNNGN